MSNLIQLMYISRATFKPTPAVQGIEPNVARILQSSRINNAKVDVGGVLFYGNGHFFQCLEGDKAAVHTLLERLHRDDRHTDVKVVSEKPVHVRRFDDWSMKYTAINDSIKTLMGKFGFKSFDPFQFDAQHFEALIDALEKMNQPDDVIDGNNPKQSSKKSSSRADKERSGLITMGIVALILIAGVILVTQLL
ncbi:BLUF domain-containing protein [Saccharospirillum impatiens]|uniref:BLUF domain-containing protein n=1 Tax=Saccharospirillum impatiens TaxID=169438 RepID=UPI000413CAEB|nr:BLUF domain-containing protein [Saccharospirillum impatiens]